MTPADFRVHLVAHSMGGLVCRAFLQNTSLGSAEARGAVDKLFTYATPHNRVDMRVLFGELRVDSILDIDDITLPAEVQKEFDDGKTIRAS